MIKVLQERSVTKKNYFKLVAKLNELRALAAYQSGYVTGETLVRRDHLIDVLIIATWISEEQWKAWETSKERIELNNKVNTLIEGELKTRIYKIPELTQKEVDEEPYGGY